MTTLPFTYPAVPGTIETQGTNVFVRWGGASFQKEAAIGPLAIAIDQAIAAAHKNTSHPGAQVPQSASGEQCQDAEAKLRRLEATNKQLRAALEFALRDMQGVREMYASKSSRVGVLAVSIGLVSAAIAKDNEDQA